MPGVPVYWWRSTGSVCAVKVPSDLPPRRPSRRRPARRIGNRGRIALIVAFVLVLVLFLSARGFANFYVDALWYRSVGQSDLYWSIIRTKLLLALVFSAGFATVLWASLVVADRLGSRSCAPTVPRSRCSSGTES